MEQPPDWNKRTLKEIKEELKKRYIRGAVGNKADLVKKLDEDDNRIREEEERKKKFRSSIRNRSPLKPQPPISGTYFDILPKDILNMVNKEREKIEINTKMLVIMMKDFIDRYNEFILEDDEEEVKDIETKIKIINDIFNKYGINARLRIGIRLPTKTEVGEEMHKPNEEIHTILFEFRDLLIVSDQALMELIEKIYTNNIVPNLKERVNGILTLLKINIRIVRVELPEFIKIPVFENGEPIRDKILRRTIKSKPGAKAKAAKPKVNNYWQVVQINTETSK